MQAAARRRRRSRFLRPCTAAASFRNGQLDGMNGVGDESDDGGDQEEEEGRGRPCRGVAR